MKSFSIIWIICMFFSNIQANEIKKLSANLSSPVGMVFDSKGVLYISNWSSGEIKIWKDNKLTNFINNIPSPTGLAIDKQDRLYIATYSDGKIYRVDKNKNIEVFISGLSVVAGLYFDFQGNLLVSERGKGRVLSISPDKNIQVLVKKGLNTPVGAIQVSKDDFVISDITGSVYIFNQKDKKLKLISDKLNAPAIGLVFNQKDKKSIYIVDYEGFGIYNILLNGKSTTMIEKTLQSPVALAMDKSGRLFIGTWSDNSLYSY